MEVNQILHLCGHLEQTSVQCDAGITRYIVLYHWQVPVVVSIILYVNMTMRSNTMCAHVWPVHLLALVCDLNDQNVFYTSYVEFSDRFICFQYGLKKNLLR